MARTYVLHDFEYQLTHPQRILEVPDRTPVYVFELVMTYSDINLIYRLNSLNTGLIHLKFENFKLIEIQVRGGKYEDFSLNRRH